MTTLFSISEQQTTIEKQALNKYGKFMRLTMYSANLDLIKAYIEPVKLHNSKFISNDNHDAGFDLYVPNKMTVRYERIHKVDHEIKCSAQMVISDGNGGISSEYSTGYYMYPRSSLSKTPLRLANSVGIIDSGYRGNLIGMFDANTDYVINKYDRLLQICAPELSPIVVNIVQHEEYLGKPTVRGDGGFGSSGR